MFGVKPNISVNHTPLDFPLLAFYCVAVFSTVLAIVNGTVTFNQSLGELRVVNLYLTFFLVTNMINDEKHLRRLLNGLFVLSILVALMMIAQYFLGDITQILPGHVPRFYIRPIQVIQGNSVFSPGQSLVLVALITIPVLLIFDKDPSKSKLIFRFLLLFIVGLAVIVTFNRNFWVAVAIAMFLVVFLISISEKIRFANLVVWLVVIVIMTTLLVLSLAGDQTQSFINGVATRFDTLLNPDTLGESSLAYRAVETEYAIPQIAAHPLIGLGLGAAYRPQDNRIDFGVLGYDKLAYIHNGHLWMILKTGIIGYLFFIWFLFLFLQRSLKYWRQIPDPFQRAIVLGFAVSVIGILPAIIVNPIFAELYWTPLLGIMIGINEVIFRLNQDHFHVSLKSVN